MNGFSTNVNSISSTAAMDTSNNSNPPLKRTRAKRSCDFCRKRKARCDADHTIPCSNCKAWGFNCEFLTVRKKRGPPSVYVENLEMRCKKMEALLISLTKTSIKEIERNDFRPDSYSNCTIKANISTNVYQSMKDNCQDSKILLDEDNDDLDYDDSSLEDDDDSEYSNSQRNSKSMDNDDITTIVNMEETLANLNLEDYDSIKYTGHSAGLQLLDENLFKSKSYLQWPGRQDVALRLISPNELLVVRSDHYVPGKRSDTRLDVGFSLTSSIFDERKSTNTPWHLAPGSLTSKSANKNNDLPSNSIIEKAVKLYFSHIHTFLPIVNKTRFETHDMKSSNVLVQAVLAVAFRFALRHFPKMFSKKSALYADSYFRKVMLRLQDSYRARLRHVQAALLMTLYLDMDETDVESMQWYTLGKAIRMAQDIGLHRSCSNWNLPASEIETRHRVFYGLYVLDRLMSARAGKPLTILDRDFDTDLPVPFEVYDDPSIKQGPSIYHSFISLIKLSEILGRILKALYAPKSKHSNSNANLDDPTILAVFDRRLKNWKASVDQVEGGVQVTPAQKVNLLLFYYTAMLLLHRPFIEFSSDSFNNNIKANIIQGSVDLVTLAADSRQACENAASNISVIIRQKQSLMSDPDSYSPLCLPTCFVYSMFQSSLIHLAIAIKNRDSLRRLRLLKRSIALLKQHEQLASALRAHNILLMLVAINNINLENLLENEATREEDNISVLNEDGLSHASPKSPIPSNEKSNELQLSTKLLVPLHQEQQRQIPSQMQTVNTNHIIPSYENNMPKSSWYQRMMNTSIIGGITPDLHQNMTGMGSSHTLEQLLPYAHDINEQSAQRNSDHNLYQHRQEDNDMHSQSHYNNQDYYAIGPTSTVPASSHNTIPASSPMTTTKRTDVYHKYHDSSMYTNSADDMRISHSSNNHHIPYNHSPILSSHQHTPHMSFQQRNGTTSTPLHQTPLPFTASSYGPNSSPHPLTSSSPATTTAATAASNTYPTMGNYLPPSSLNWSDWGVYLGYQQNSSIPAPPMGISPEHNYLNLNCS